MRLSEWALVVLVISVIPGAFGINDVTYKVAATAKVLYGLFVMTAAILWVLDAMGIRPFV